MLVGATETTESSLKQISSLCPPKLCEGIKKTAPKGAVSHNHSHSRDKPDLFYYLL